MALDAELVRAVNEAVRETGQTDALTKRLLAWLEAMSASELTSEDDNAFLNTTLSVIRLTSDGRS